MWSLTCGKFMELLSSFTSPRKYSKIHRTCLVTLGNLFLLGQILMTRYSTRSESGRRGNSVDTAQGKRRRVSTPRRPCNRRHHSYRKRCLRFVPAALAKRQVLFGLAFASLSEPLDFSCGSMSLSCRGPKVLREKHQTQNHGQHQQG